MFIKLNHDGTRLHWGRALLVMILGIWLTACATPETPPNVSSEQKAVSKTDEEMARLQAGLNAFHKADYQNAIAVFDELAKTAQDPAVKRNALYAQSCTRLIVAQTADEYSSALMLWDSWSRQSPAWQDEDPRMLTPILERISPTSGLDVKGALSIQEAKPKKKQTPRTIYVSKDVAAYKSIMENREKEFERMKSRLELKEREVRRLKQQIESLEAIHLKFQEKQKEISTP